MLNPTVVPCVLEDGLRLSLRVHEPETPSDGSSSFLLVHGLASNARLWDGVGSFLAQAGHRSVAVDLRAHGESDGRDRLGFDDVVHDLTRVIELAALERPVAVGQSWGGNVVLELGAIHPELVSGVVGVDGGLITLMDRFVDAQECWDTLAPPTFEHLRWADLETLIAARMKGWPEGAVRAQLGNLMAAENGTVRAILTRPRHRTILEHLYHHRPLDRLGRLEVPMLLLAVTGHTRAVLTEERIAAADDASRSPFAAVRLPGRDHDVHLQEPATVARLIRDWLAGHALPETV